MPGTRPRILLSEGSSLTARETITALGLAGHRVEIVSSERFGLCRFSRFVRKVHPAPPSGSDPDGYLDAVLRIIADRRVDVLMPVHEQAYLFAAARARLPRDLAIAVADFDAFEQVQNKATFSVLLTRLGVPQPDTEVVGSAAAFRHSRPFPFFVKAAFGTASEGVWRVADADSHEALLRQMDAHDMCAGGLLVQAAVRGPLERMQSVFDRGRLVAIHAYRQIEEGPGGGDVIKRSVRNDAARDSVARIGAALNWHGALSFDYIVDDATGEARFIDANPRIVEPMNAWLSGVDLAGALLQVSQGEAPPPHADGREGVTTTLGLMALLDAGRRHGRRRDVLAEAGALARRTGRFRDTREELVPLRTDPWCIAPVAVVVAALLRDPQAAARLSKRTVSAYSLTPAAIARIRQWRQASDAVPQPSSGPQAGSLA